RHHLPDHTPAAGEGRAGGPRSHRPGPGPPPRRSGRKSRRPRATAAPVRSTTPSWRLVTPALTPSEGSRVSSSSAMRATSTSIRRLVPAGGRGDADGEIVIDVIDDPGVTALPRVLRADPRELRP